MKEGKTGGAGGQSPLVLPSGFTLLEVLIALVIAAFALGALYDGALGGLRAAKVAGHYEEAISLARSHLAELSQRQSAQALDVEGKDGAVFRYRIHVARLAGTALQRSVLEQANSRPGRMAALYALNVTEFWTDDGHHREVRLAGENMVVQPGAQ